MLEKIGREERILNLRPPTRKNPNDKFGVTHGNHPRSIRLARIFQCLAVPRQPLKLLENTGKTSSEKAGVGGSTPSLATILSITCTSRFSLFRRLAAIRVSVGVRA